MTEFHYHSDLSSDHIVTWLNNSVEGILFSIWSLHYGHGPFGTHFDAEQFGPEEVSFAVWVRTEMRRALDARRLLDY